MKPNENFLDSKTILAILLVGAVWFGWQSYLTKKYPKAAAVETTPGANPPILQKQEAKSETKALEKNDVIAQKNLNVKETFIDFESDLYRFRVSNFGMGLSELVLKKFNSRENRPIEMGSTSAGGLFAAISIETGHPIVFEITQKSANIFEGTAEEGGVKINRTIEFNPQYHSFTNKIKVTNTTAKFAGLKIEMNDKKMEGGSSSFLIPSFEHQEFFTFTNNVEDRINITSAKENIEKPYAGSSIIAIGSQYFVSALLDKSEVLPEVRVTAVTGDNKIKSQAIYKNLGGKPNYDIEFISYAGPKSFNELKAIDVELARVVNLGFFSSISKWLLIIMRWFHQFVANWGFAIIALTLLMRILVLPFNLASYKSMKKMQKIQPAIAALREKYKEDAQAMNKEMMLLMKNEKVNPIGGCLPMLLQMPIFFALYQVIGQSVELYQAPFIFWIHDLTLKDPFYVLPVLMGVTMFIQQKITPTTMDPVQAKVLQFLPIVFALMMVTLPAGLTLYIFVSTLFGVLQQQLFMKLMAD
jgi:YidC/Oxa1 family membrane protein insertase